MQRSFPIFIRRKIPYITSGILFTIIIFSALAFILYAFLLPARNASAELSSAYYTTIIPEWVKNVSGIGLIGLCLTVPLYYVAKSNQQADLIIAENYFRISGKRFELNIYTSNVKRIYFNELKNNLGKPTHKIQLVIQQMNNTSTSLILINYNDADYVLKCLSKFKNIEFDFFDRDMNALYGEE